MRIASRTPTPSTITDVTLPPIEVLEHLSPAEVHAVQHLAARSAAADGAYPLSEHVTLHLQHGGDRGVRHVIARADGVLAAYAHLDTTDEVEGPSAEIAVDPQWRRQGLASAIVGRIAHISGDERLRLWSHGENAPAGALARSLGFQQTRVLWQMRRSLYAAVPRVDMPEGFALRTFLPGVDDEDWVAVNARAFVSLPDQGRWTLGDLHRRMREPWFDPTGFLVATDRDGRMAGFHWTKVHGAHPMRHGHPDEGSPVSDRGAVHDHGPSGVDRSVPHHSYEHDADHHHADDHGHPLLGEVYVVGVDPTWQGRGLGRALLVAGLQHLRGLGLAQVMLYVDRTNEPAISAYDALGFTHWDTDVLYRRSAG